MAMRALAQETLCTLRHEIARIEGVLPEQLTESDCAPEAGPDTGVLIRQSGRGVATKACLPTRIAPLDEVLEGGLPLAALTEIHAPTARTSAVMAAWTLFLGHILLQRSPYPDLPLLWLGTRESFNEAGRIYPPALQTFGVSPQRFLFAEAQKLRDVLWIGEEAASLPDLAAVVVEVRGNPRLLDLTATRRLHRRAQAAGRPVFLLRQAAEPGPTAAPVRLEITTAPASPRQTLEGPLFGSLGPPGLTVTITKSRTARLGSFTLEWNPDDCCYRMRQPARFRSTNQTRPAVSSTVVSLSSSRAHLAQTAGQEMGPANTKRRAAGGE